MNARIKLPVVDCTVRHSSKQDCAIAWLPFHDLILRAAAKVGAL